MNEKILIPGAEKIFKATYKPYSTIVVEISRGRLVSHPELPRLDLFFNELLDYALKEKKRVVPMASEFYAVYYLFVRTDNKAGTYEALAELEDLFDDPEFYQGTMIYMDRLSLDTFDLGEKILARSGTPYIYTKGEKTLTYLPAERKSTKFGVRYPLDVFYRYCRQRIIGQDEQLKKALFLIDRFVMDMSGNESPAAAPSFFLTAPSGSGKTELYRSVKAFFRQRNIPVPVVNIDATQLTPAGYKGDSVSIIADTILSDTNFAKSRCAICFIDEADKKIMPDLCGEGDFNAMTQTNLLRVLEGTVLRGEHERIKLSDDLFNLDDDETYINSVDTSRVLFILMGSFQEIRDRRCESRRSAGFGSRCGEEEKRFEDDITVEEMIEAGMLEEIAGRVSRVINFRPLSPDTMRELLRRKAILIGNDRNAEVALTDKALDGLVPLAYTPLGIRKPMNLISELADDALAEAAYSGELYLEGENVVLIDSLTRAVFSKRSYELPKEDEGSFAETAAVS